MGSPRIPIFKVNLPGGGDISARVMIRFSPEKLDRLLTRATRQSLNYGGAYVRRAAQRSIKKKGEAKYSTIMGGYGGRRLVKKEKRFKTDEQRIAHEREAQRKVASKAPAPPFTHTGFLRDDIIYGYDPTTESVPIGPWRSPWLNKLMEHGGAHQMVVWQKAVGTHVFGRTWLARPGRRFRNAKAIKTRTAIYPARPFMRPALERSYAAVTKMWHGSIRN